MIPFQRTMLVTAAAFVLSSVVLPPTLAFDLTPNYELAPQLWWDTVGSTPFDPANALDISFFCTDPNATDHTECVQNWLEAGRAQGKHLFASKGTYTLNDSLIVFDGMHIQCESSEAVVFRKQNGSTNPHFRSELSDEPVNHVTDILVENCGFDMNGDPKNFGSAFKLNSANEVTFRGNRIFDSTGTRSDARDQQRQYVLILNATDILMENNHFSEGGRIKVGRPGRRIIIRDNLLDFVNDNGITIVGRDETPWADGTNVTEDILIDGNTILDPTVTGIFFGSDGQPHGVGVTIRGLTITNNIIRGGLAGSCIKGTLPDNVSSIFIANNHCDQQIPTFDWNDGRFITGIQLGRADDTTGRAEEITLLGNKIEAETPETLGNGAIFIDRHVEVCVLDNNVVNSGLAAWFRADSIVLVSGNDWGGGTVRADSSDVQKIEVRDNCYNNSSELITSELATSVPEPAGILPIFGIGTGLFVVKRNQSSKSC